MRTALSLALAFSWFCAGGVLADEKEPVPAAPAAEKAEEGAVGCVRVFFEALQENDAGKLRSACSTESWQSWMKEAEKMGKGEKDLLAALRGQFIHPASDTRNLSDEPGEGKVPRVVGWESEKGILRVMYLDQPNDRGGRKRKTNGFHLVREKETWKIDLSRM